MRTQSANPFFRKYGSRLPRSGRYPASDVLVLYNRDKHERVKDLEVVYKPDTEGPVKERKLYQDFIRYTRKWECDLPIESHDGPAGLFDYLMEEGFADQAELRQALMEFANIEGCEWAIGMLDEIK